MSPSLSCPARAGLQGGNMPIHFNPDGRVSVDTVDEAIRFEQRRSKPTNCKIPKQPRKKRGPRLEGWDGFLDFLTGPENATARKILALVQGSADGIDRHSLATHLECEVQVVTGTVTGIKRKASAVGIDPNDVITKDPQGRYRPGRLLAQHGAPMP